MTAPRGPRVQADAGTGRVVLANGRLELVVETKPALNARSLRDLDSGRVFADRDYRWHGVERPILVETPTVITGADGGCRVVLTAAAGGVEIVQTFTAPAHEADLVTEVVTLRNPGRAPVEVPDFRAGFARQVQEGIDWAPGIAGSRFCDVPYRYHPETGDLCDYSVSDLMAKASWFSTVRSTMYDRRISTTWGAEGWAWYQAGSVLLVSKYNQEEMEWSLLQVERGPATEGPQKILRFGGAGRWKLGDPQGPATLAPGTSFSFGVTRYQVMDGEWKAAYAAYRRFTEGRGHRVPDHFDPPVHWNELYDNRLWWVGDSVGNRAAYYTRADMEKEAETARELGCQCLYLDPGWDTVFGSNIWADDRLGSQESFVAWLREKYGMPLALHTPLAPWSDPSGYPDEARRMDRDGKRLGELCCASSVYIQAKVSRLKALCARGAYFLMYDGSWFPGECWDPSHGHSVPETHREHLAAILTMAQRVHAEHPRVLIEQHDPMTGPGTPRYAPTYIMHGTPGAFDELWGFEYMIDPMDDIISRRAFSLYYLNLAYSIPVYLHIDLRKDNAHALMLWWYASTCRHLGVGGTPSDPAVWAAQKDAMKLYLAHKAFFTRGTFHGIDETVHAHTLREPGECVINCFNLDAEPVEKTVRFLLADVGLPAGRVHVEGAPSRQDGEAVTLDLAIPAGGRKLRLRMA